MGAKVIIQGFGAVGSSLAYYLSQWGCKIVGICDKDGFLCDPDGISVRLLLNLRKKALSTQDHKPATQRQEIGKNIIRTCLAYNASQDYPPFDIVLRDPNWSPEEFLLEFLQGSGPADIFCPCAGRYAVTSNVANFLITHPHIRVLASGANNPFGTRNANGILVEDISIATLLSNQGVIVIRDAICNSGTAQLFHRGLSIPFDLTQPSAVGNILQACAKPIIDFLDQALSQAGDPTLLWAASTRLIEERILHPIPMERMDITAADPIHPTTKFASIQSADCSSKGVVFPENSTLEEKECTNDTTTMPDHPYSFEPLTKFEPGYETVQDRVHRILSLGEECVEVTELIQLMENPASPLVAYDGFEPSGKMNIAQALFKKHIVNEMQKCGFTFLFWIADFFAMLNLKQGGDMNKIKLLGKYFQEVWIACGMKMDRVVFLWAFDEILTRPKDYLQLVFDIATKSSLARVRKCSTIMGRTEEESQLQSSQILYPIFQCADIFFLGVDVCQLGMDQRKVNMLARDFADSSSQKDQNLSSDVDSKHNVDPPNHTDKKGKRKPIVLSHHMLAGLKKGQAKMSKSDPESCIYMNDSAEMVQAKIQKAYCPTGPKPHSSHFPIYLSCSFCVCVYNCFVGPDAEKDNPCLEYFKYIVFPNLEKKPLVLECTISIFKVGGANNAMEVPDVTDVKLYPTYSHLLKDYLSSAIYPNDLKTSLAKELNKLIEPVREHFRTNVKAAQLLEQVQQQCQ